MNKIVIFVAILNLPTISHAEPDYETLTTTEGKTYNKVTVSKITPSELRILHESGATSIPLSLLSMELQEKYKYNPVAEAEYRRKEIEARRKYEENLRKQRASQLEEAGNSESVPKMAHQTREIATQLEQRLREENQAGFEAFLERGLNLAGSRILRGSDNKGFVYTENGPFKGLTQGQATEKARAMWSRMSANARKPYIDRALGLDIRSKQEREQGLTGKIVHSAINNEGYRDDHRREIFLESIKDASPEERQRLLAEFEQKEELRKIREELQRAREDDAFKRTINIGNDIYDLKGRRLTLRSNPSQGYSFRGKLAYDIVTGQPTHTISGNILIPIDSNSHPKITLPSN